MKGKLINHEELEVSTNKASWQHAVLQQSLILGAETEIQPLSTLFT